MPDSEVSLHGLSADGKRPELERLLNLRRTTRSFGDGQLSLAELAALIWSAQGVLGDTRRTCPSAHGLYTLCLTVVAGNVTGLDAGVWRYDPHRNLLTSIALGDRREPVAATSLADYDWLRQATALLIVSADMQLAKEHFADQPPYGQRGERYVWMEAGCVAQNVYLCAAERGLGAALIGGFDDEGLCGLGAGVVPDRHDPLALLGIGHSKQAGRTTAE